MELFDETLDINATENYDLSLELSEEGLSMAVLDLLRGKYVLLRHYPLALPEGNGQRTHAEIIRSDDFLRKHYRKVYIIAPSPHFTLVPSAVFDPSLRDDYFRFSHSTAPDSKITANNLPFPGAMVLFAPERGVEEATSSCWPGIILWHQTKPLLQHISTACRSSEDRYIHLHYEKSFITIIIAEKRSLAYCNSFVCPDASDAGYYLFNVLESRGVKRDETIHLSGSVEPYSEAHLAILNFAENVKFASPMIRHGFSYVMHEIARHRWLNLFTAASCE
jgi:hypothetical protein